MKMKSVLGIFVLICGISIGHAQTEDHNYYEPGDSLQGESTDLTGMAGWCRDRLMILRKARAKASQAIFRGQYQAAIQVMIQGLASAAANGYTINPPLTQKMLERGVVLGREINARISGNPAGAKGTTLFLESYYGLVEEVAESIDIPYYRPGRCGYCEGANVDEMEEALLSAVHRQISLVNDHLLLSGSLVPLGPADLYLKSAEMLTYFTLNDLRGSLYVNYYACQIEQLKMLHRELTAFNSVRQPEGLKPQMVATVYHELNDILGALSYRSGCY